MRYLRPKEMAVLTYLVENAGRTCTREELCEAADIPNLSLTSTLSRLRNAIEDDSEQPQLIITVHGEGYRFEPPQAG